MKDLLMIFNTADIKDDIPNFMSRSANSHNIAHELIFMEDLKLENGKLLHKNKPMAELPKLVLFRCRGQIEFDLYDFFDKNNIRIVNNKDCLLACNDKLTTHNLVASTGSKQPGYMPYKKGMSYQEASSKLGAEFIMKDKFGLAGKEVFLIKNKDDFDAAMKNIPTEHLIFQEYVKESFGKDLRVYIVDNKITGAMMRKNDGGKEFRSNISQGALPYKFELSDAQKKNTQKIAKALKIEIGSVDYLFKGDVLYFCEANSTAAVDDPSKIGIPIVDKIMEYVKNIITKQQAQTPKKKSAIIGLKQADKSSSLQ